MSKKDNNGNGSGTNIPPSNENKKTDNNTNTLPWYKKTWGKTAIILVLVFILGKQILGLGTFLILAGIVAIIGSIFSLIKKKKIGKSIIALIIGLILLPVGSNFMSTNSSTQSAHSAKVQKVNHKESTRTKTKKVNHKEKVKAKTKKVKNNKQSKSPKATTLVANHKTTKAKHHQSANKKDAHSDLSNNNTQQITTKQNSGNGNVTGYERQEGYVFVAPEQGKRYHVNPHCRGLKKANNITKLTLAEAKAQGYTQCRINGDN